jgi:ferredoxin
VIQAGRLTWVMATLSERLPENLPGRYYVDASCIDCDQCRALAPQIFTRNDQGLSFVSQQPTTSEEIAQVEDILSGCATSSIGNDGA